MALLGNERMPWRHCATIPAMKPSAFALSLAACLCASAAGAQSKGQGAAPPPALQDCLASNYDPALRLFTLRNPSPGQPSQQCLLTVSPAGLLASATLLPAGRYRINLSDGGDGGAGGTLRAANAKGGGGGGGGAGGREVERVVDLVEGSYKLTLGAGGPGGSACLKTPTVLFSGGPGWLGSPSSLVRIDTAEVLLGKPGADKHVRPSKRQNEKFAGNQDAHGGSGPGKTTGGSGGHMDVTGSSEEPAEAGYSRAGNEGGAPGAMYGDTRLVGSGGGGGASTKSEGGDGGGELRGRWSQPPERGLLGSGGGGGEGTQYLCSAGAPGGNGFMSLRAYQARSADASDPASGPNSASLIR